MFERFIENRKLNKVRQLLQLERKRLLEGPIDGLLPLVEEREKLISQMVESERLSLEDIKGIQVLARANQRLFKASLNGFSAARESFRRPVLAPSATYTENGKRIESGQAPQRDRKV